MTTNHVAERAGVSIGTLYGYFPNKSALLRAMAQQELVRQQEYLQLALSDPSLSSSPEALIRLVIRAALRPFAARSKVRQHFLQLLLSDAMASDTPRDERQHVLQALLAALAERWPDCAVSLSDIAQYTLASAVMGAAQAVAIERPGYFETQESEDEIVKTVLQRTTRPTS